MELFKNWGVVTVSTGYNSSDTSIALQSGDGAKLPSITSPEQFRLVWWNYSDYPNPADDPYAEIVVATARSTDTLTIVRPASGNNYHGEGSDNDAQAHNTGGKTYKMALVLTKKIMDDIFKSGVENLVKNGNFHNNSTNGYGVVNNAGDDWVNAGGNAIGGGAFPPMTKQQLIDLLGIADGDIEGLWKLDETSGNATDLSANSYNLTDTNTVGSSDDGLIGKARDFELGSSEYFTIADGSCPNLEITGNKTYFCLFKPESIGTTQYVMAKSPSGAAAVVGIRIGTTGSVDAICSGLSVDNLVSDVKLEAGKWYLLVMVHDNSNTKLKIWVNGVKKESTSTGTTTDTNGAFSIGRLGADTGAYYTDGLMQFAGVLSVALSDAQVKRLFAATLWKGLKMRRATSDGLVYQYLDEHLVERLRGRTVTLVAKMYQDTANVGGIRVNDGSSYESADTSTTGEWVDVFVTTTISSTATAIYIGLLCNSADGNVWFKEVALYEGAMAHRYQPSQNDLIRFPRLLRIDIPEMTALKPYQYEESRWYDYTPTYSCSGSMTISSVTTVSAKGCFFGKWCKFGISFYGTTGGSASNGIYASLPMYPVVKSGGTNFVFSGQARDGGGYISGISADDSNSLPSRASILKYDASNFGLGTVRGGITGGAYPIN